MQNVKKQKSNIILFVWCMISICAFLGAWCCSTLYYKGKVSGLVYLIISLCAAICYAKCILHSVLQYKESKTENNILSQIKIVNVLVLFLFGGMFLGDIKSQEKDLLYILIDCVWMIFTIWLMLKCNMKIKFEFRKIVDNIMCDKFLWILILIVLCLAIEPGKIQVRWDGAFYERECRNVMNIHSLSTLGAVGHLSQAFGVLYCLGYTLLGDSKLTLATLNIFFYLGSIVGYYHLVELICPKTEKTTRVIGTMAYAFSPFLLGMVNYYSLDYMPMCLFVWVIFFAYKKYWILHFVTASCFVFTKEPIITAYAGICLGLLISDWKVNDCRKIKDKVWCLLRKPQYYFMLMVGFVWLAMFLMFAGWGGSGSFGINPSYMIEKVKVLFLMNYNWLLCIITALSIIQILVKKKITNIMWSLPLIVSVILYTVFNLFYITVNHARYSAIVPVALNLVCFGYATIVLKEIWIKSGTLIISALMLISCFKTVDPVSLHIFDTMNTGTEIMITTSEKIIGDMMIYNKQMLGEEDAFNQALEYAITEGAVIYIPTYNYSMYHFDGSMLSAKEEEGYYSVETWWNKKKKRREVYQTKECISFEINEIYGDTNSIITKAHQKGNKVCYIYASWLGEEQAEKLKANLKGVESRQFQKNGWIIKALLIN